MTSIQRLNPDNLGHPSNYGFTNIAVVPTGHQLVFISGQGGRNPDDGRLADDFETQLKQAFDNLRRALSAAGAAPENVVKITVLSVNHNAEQQQLISAQRNAMWPDELVKPTSSLIPVPRLASDGMLFEIDAIAAVPAT